MTRSEEIVPGMAEAIEARMTQLGIGPSELARRANITAQGLLPLRKGYRRNYNIKLKQGATRALQWTSDSVDRLLRGEQPIESNSTVEAVNARITPELQEWIESLDDAGREKALALIRISVEVGGARALEELVRAVEGDR